MDMLILFGVLVLGGLAGWRWRRVAWAVTWNRNLTKATIAVLLGVMGAKLALHRNLFAQDAGVFLLAVGSSLLLLLLFTGIFALAGLLRRHPKLEAHGDATGPGHGKAALRSVALNGGCIALGFGLLALLPASLAARLPVDAATTWILWALLLFVGFDLGVEAHHLDLRKLPPHLLLVPVANIALSLGSGLLVGAFTKLTLREGLLLHAGLGWYSLSSVLLAERGLVLLSILAFIHNVARELLAILSAPLAARLNPYLPIYLGGATSMDVMLPFVQAHSGRAYTLVSFYSGVVCSLAVVPLVRLIAGRRVPSAGCGKCRSPGFAPAPAGPGGWPPPAAACERAPRGTCGWACPPAPSGSPGRGPAPSSPRRRARRRSP